MMEEVELENFGAQTETQKGTIIDIDEYREGIEYTIQTEKPRPEKRWKDEIVDND